MFKYLLLLLFIASCSRSENDKKLKQDILKCISMRSETYADNLFNIHEKYFELEKFLIKKSVLKSKSKEAYMVFFSELFESKKDVKKNNQLFKEIIKEVKYSEMLIDPGIFHGPIECVRFHIEKNELHKKEYSKYYLNLNNIVDNFTYENQSAYFDLIENTPNNKFGNIIFRAPLLSIYFGALEYSIRN